MSESDIHTAAIRSPSTTGSSGDHAVANRAIRDLPRSVGVIQGARGAVTAIGQRDEGRALVSPLSTCNPTSGTPPDITSAEHPPVRPNNPRRATTMRGARGLRIRMEVEIMLAKRRSLVLATVALALSGCGGGGASTRSGAGWRGVRIRRCSRRRSPGRSGQWCRQCCPGRSGGGRRSGGCDFEGGEGDTQQRHSVLECRPSSTASTA